MVFGDTRRVSVTALKRTVSFHSCKSLGFLYKEKEEIKKGIESFLSAIKLFPTDGECYYELGMLYIKTGDKSNAIKFLQKYLEYGIEKEKEVHETIERLKKIEK